MEKLALGYVFVAIFPSIIYGFLCHEAEELPGYETVLKLDEMARKGELIDQFKPTESGFLGGGSIGFTYKGTLRPNGREVAMKFTSSEGKLEARREYEIYSYLDAINNTAIESKGIPSVYYFGEWEDYTLMAITLLDPVFTKKINAKDIDETDILIISREFVRITKYIHSRGIHHNDIKYGNIMFRKHQCFIIDYNLASTMYKSSRGKISQPSVQRTFEDGRRAAKEDRGSFLSSMSDFFGLELEWLQFSKMHEILLGKLRYLWRKLAQDIKQIKEIEDDGLSRVFGEFASYVFEDQIESMNRDNGTRVSIYDKIYEIINEEIAKYKNGKPVLVSWLTEEEEEKALQDLEEHPIPTNITFITDPFNQPMLKYKSVNFEYFSKKKHTNAQSSRNPKKR
ncbi:uncharacterized protein LOC116340563 [Contarinia nasturtii]|uniref:uncharacterized protein LOC116340563 n=1 Tax=Contarinia nasturtii TaxID=265458 RepID=UPI0012D37D81|nr:uncharacterized protein LOC116340563 [Contarinia nasturtii]